MIFNTFELHQEGSLPGAHLVTYIQEYSEAMAINDRPLILLCPGGGYTRTSDREAEPMALKFLAMGYHAAVLRYSCAPAEYPTSLKELAYSVRTDCCYAIRSSLPESLPTEDLLRIC